MAVGAGWEKHERMVSKSPPDQAETPVFILGSIEYTIHKKIIKKNLFYYVGGIEKSCKKFNSSIRKPKCVFFKGVTFCFK